MKDWLINVINISATVKKALDGNPVLTIGLSCALSMHPDFTTIDFYSHEKQAWKLLRALTVKTVQNLIARSHYSSRWGVI